MPKKAIKIILAGVKYIWLRNDLSAMSNRHKALEANQAQDGFVSRESQLVVFNRGQKEKEAHGEFVSELHSGNCEAQDMFYFGNQKGIGRIYHKVFVNTYRNVAGAKLYDRNTALAAADMLTNRVFFLCEPGGLSLIVCAYRDRGTEYCGKPDDHEYELYLAVENIERMMTEVRNP